MLARSRETKRDTVLLHEGELFSSCPFSFERRGQHARGFLRIRARIVNLEEIESVVLRLPRLWWPAEGFDLQDQMFVYHETIASWYALFESLHCSVLNRFGLGWWLQDGGYPIELRARLARGLGLTVSNTGDDLVPATLKPTPRDSAVGVESVYRARGISVAAPGCGRDLAAYLVGVEEALWQWERETGIALYRIDFERNNGTRVKWVETYPLIEEEPTDVVTAVSTAALAGMMSMQQVTT